MCDLGVSRLSRAIRRSRVVLAVGLAMLLSLPGNAKAGKNKWAPILPADMAMTQSNFDPDAGAEVLLWTIRVEDQLQGHSLRTIIRHELRTKVLNVRGAEAAGRVELAHPRDVSIEDIAARTVRPDGSVVELSDDQIFDRTLVKSSRTRLEVKAFAFPAVTPGCILDYRWTEIRYGDDAGYVYLEFQRDQPVREIDLRVKPLPLAGSGFNFKMRTFNMPTPSFVDDGDGFHYAVLPPVPARREEPYMPPRLQSAPWSMLYYVYGDDPSPDELWKRHAASVLGPRKSAMASDGTVKAMATAIVSGSGSPAQSADRLDDWCRTNIDDLSDDRLFLSDTDRRKQPDNKRPADTLKRRRGEPLDLVYLFIAMCRSVGIGARLAVAADRSEVYFDASLGLPQLLKFYCAAIPWEGGWRFYDPSERWLDPGMLAWFMEGEDALVLDPEKPEFARTPLDPPESTVVARSARIRLASDGSAEGAIRSEYRGHQGSEMHERYDELAPDARVALYRKDLPANMKTFEFDSVLIEGADDPLQAIVERAAVQIPAYAQPIGDRLLVPLSFFEWNAEPVFSTSTRRLPVFFPYAWSFVDTVRVEIPQDYEVESIPKSEPGIEKGVARYKSHVLVSVDGRVVLFIRRFSFGLDGVISFPVEQYPSLKGLFDRIARLDEATLSLKRKP